MLLTCAKVVILFIFYNFSLAFELCHCLGVYGSRSIVNIDATK